MKKVAEFKGHQGAVYSVKIANNQNFVVSGGEDKKVMVWDIKKKCRFAVFDKHLDYVFKVLVCDDDEFVVSADFSDGIRVWSISDQRQILSAENNDKLKEWLEKNIIIKDQFSRFIFDYLSR